LTGAVGGRSSKVIAGTIIGGWTQPTYRDDSGRVMSSEHATGQVPLAEIREGDMLQDPKSGNWIKVVQTADGTMSVTHRYADGRGR
jgi:hypothetical protein